MYMYAISSFKMPRCRMPRLHFIPLKSKWRCILRPTPYLALHSRYKHAVYALFVHNMDKDVRITSPLCGCPATAVFPASCPIRPIFDGVHVVSRLMLLDNVTAERTVKWYTLMSRHPTGTCTFTHIFHDYMTTSSNGNIFRVTGLLCGEFIGDRWIPHTNASDAELWYFL